MWHYMSHANLNLDLGTFELHALHCTALVQQACVSKSTMMCACVNTGICYIGSFSLFSSLSLTSLYSAILFYPSCWLLYYTCNWMFSSSHLRSLQNIQGCFDLDMVILSATSLADKLHTCLHGCKWDVGNVLVDIKLYRRCIIFLWYLRIRDHWPCNWYWYVWTLLGCD